MYGSAVFLRAGSLDLGAGLINLGEGSLETNDIFEFCEGNILEVNFPPSLTDTTYIYFDYSGSAVNDICQLDGSDMPESLTILPEEVSGTIAYKVKSPVIDGGDIQIIATTVRAGCEQADTINLFVYSIISEPVVVTTSACTPGAGSIAVTATTGGSPNKRISINGGINWQPWNQPFTGLSPGTYELWITDYISCDTLFFEETIYGQPVLSNETTTIPAICSDGTAEYTATCDLDGATFSWIRIPAAGILPPPIGIVHGAIILETLTNTTNAPITVTYVYTLTHGDCVNTQEVTVMVYSELLQPDPVGTTIPYKTIHTINLDAATGGFGAITYLWQESDDGKIWVPATPPNNTQNYTTPTLTCSKYYRRQAEGEICGDTIISEPAFIIVSNLITLIPDPLVGGDLSGDGNYDCGDKVIVKADPNGCYNFIEWTDENGITVSDENPYEFTATEDLTLIALFAQKLYEVTVSVNLPEGGTAEGSQDNIPCGDWVTVTAEPDTCYHFRGWEANGNIVNLDLEYRFEITPDLINNFPNSYDLTAIFELKTFTITLVVLPNIHYGTATGGGTFDCLDEVNITTVPSDCYIGFINWTDENGTVISTTPDIPPFLATEDRTLIANYFEKTFDILTSVNLPEGGTVVGGGYNKPCGEYITLTAILDPCYSLVEWTDDDDPAFTSSDNPLIFLVMDSRNLTAHFILDDYDVFVSANSPFGGTVTGGGNFFCGDTVTVSAEADTCYTFTGWTESGNTVCPTLVYEFVLGAANRNLVANFSLDYYNVNASTSPAGGGTITGHGSHACGDTVTLTVTPDLCYTFLGWTDEGGNTVCSDLVYKFPLGTTGRSFVAHFLQDTYDVFVSADSPLGGTATGNGNFGCGDPVTVTATLDPCYIFMGWTENGILVWPNLVYPFIMGAADRNLVANFQIKTFVVTVAENPEVGGIITGANTYDCGTNVAVEIFTDECYGFIEWTEGGVPVSTDNPYTFDITENRNLVANVSKFIYPIVVTSNFSYMGNITANGIPITSGDSIHIACGDHITVTATVSHKCYTFAYWMLNGVQISTSSSFTISNVTMPNHLEAVFIPTTYRVILTEDPPESGWACCTDTAVACNSEIYVMASDTNPMYKFTHWSEGAQIYTDNPHNFIVDRDYNLKANFEVRTFSVYTNAWPTEGGSTEGGGNHIPYGTTITVEAYANQDYNFHNWTDQDNVVRSWDAIYSFEVYEDAVLTANFIIQSHRIRVYAVPPEGGTVAGDTLFISQGAIHTITATAFPDFHFKYWTTDSANGTIIHQAGPVFEFPVEGSRDFYAHFERDSYIVTFEVIPHHGGYTVPNDTIVIWGTKLNIEAIENPFFTFNGWSRNGVPVSMSPVISPTITEDCHFVAYFTSETFEVTVLAAPEAGGSVWSTDTSEVPYLTPVTITATPDSCYNFICWMEADTVVTENPVYTFEIEGNRIFTAIFEIKIFMITAFANPGGTVDIEAAYMDCGDEFTVIAKPDIGYRFINWTVNNEEFSTNDTLTFIVNDSLNLVAHFEYVTHHIILDRMPYPGGTVQNAGIYPLNYDLTVHAIPNPGFKFVRWMEEDTIEASLNKDYQFFVDRDRTLTAHFTNDSLNVILRVNPMQNGWGTVEGGGTDIPYETLVTIKAIPKDNFEFVNWTEEDDSVFHKYDTLTFPVVRSLNLTANFKPRDFTVNVSANPEPGGTVTGGGTFEYGSVNTIMAYPNLQYEYEFENWVDIDSNRVISWQPEYIFIVQRNYNFVANFTPKYCKVTVTADPATGGKVEGSIDSIPMGTLWTVRAEPNDHYVFVKWTENGDSIHNKLDYEFIVTEDRNLTAHFIKETVFITISADPPQAAATLSGDGAYYHGDSVTVEAISNEHYFFQQWTVNEKSISDENPHSFLAEQSEGWVAIFGTNTYTITLLCNPPDVATLEGGGTFTYGEQTTIQAFPDACYEFVEWTEADTAVTGYTFMVDRDRTFVAHFTQNRFNITTTASPTAGGTAMPENSDLGCGAEITLYAEAHEGHSFVNWTEGDEIVCDTTDYTFEVIRSRHLTANFTPNIYNITVIADPPSFGLATGGGDYHYGEEITVYATPGNNYDFVSWTEDSIVSSNAAYKFTVTGSRILTANFEVPRLDFDTYVATLWNNTFLLNLKRLEDENFDIVGCKWFKNGIELMTTNTKDQFSYSAGSNKSDRLDLAPHYYSFQLITGYGEFLYSTNKVLTDYIPAPAKNQLLVYPNPVGSGNTFTVERLTKDTPIEVFNQYGVCLSRTVATDEITTLNLNLPSGVYFIRNDHKEAKLVIIR